MPRSDLRLQPKHKRSRGIPHNRPTKRVTAIKKIQTKEQMGKGGGGGWGREYMVVSHGPTKLLVVVHHCALFGENFVPALKLASHGETDVKDKMQQPNIHTYIYIYIHGRSCCCTLKKMQENGCMCKISPCCCAWCT